MQENNEKRERTKKIIKRTLIILLLLFLAASAYLVYYLYGESQSSGEYNKVLITKQPVQSVTNEKVDNPVDFDALTETNDEIYGWIEISDTKVNYPIVQSKTNDEFYLKHSAVDKSYIASGAIYTELCNAKDFNDPITLIYGHNGYSDTMFTTLHNFENKEFFDEHEYFYIYLPGKQLTYQVISAFKYDDRHIMNTFNFLIPDDLEEFQATVTNPDSSVKNVRTELDVPIDRDSKIIVLSTCITGQKAYRYLVCAVLVDVKETN